MGWNVSWLTTFTGHRFYPTEPDVRKIDIRDIAHALSNQCRFAGHSKWHYSVAQHSVLVAQILREDGHDSRVQLRGLLHDAAEAYLTDIPSPIKHLDFMEEYRQLEDRLEIAISLRFLGLALPLGCPIVKGADLRALTTEARDLVSDPNAMHSWTIIRGIRPRMETIERLQPEQAESKFLARYSVLVDRMKQTAREEICRNISLQ
jgi:hypothetical protein